MYFWCGKWEVEILRGGEISETSATTSPLPAIPNLEDSESFGEKASFLNPTRNGEKVVRNPHGAASAEGGSCARAIPLHLFLAVLFLSRTILRDLSP